MFRVAHAGAPSAGSSTHVVASKSSSAFREGQSFAMVAVCRSQSVSPIGVWWGAAVLTLLQAAGNGDSGVQTEQIGVWWGAAVLTLLQTAGNSDSEAQTEQIGVWWGAAVLTLVQTAGNGDSGVQTEQIGVWWGFAVLTLVQTAGNGDFSGYEQPFSRRENVQPRRTHRSWPRS